MFKILIFFIFVLSVHANDELLKLFNNIQKQEKSLIIKKFKQEQYLILNIREKISFHKKHKRNKHKGGLQYHKNIKNHNKKINSTNNQHGKN